MKVQLIYAYGNDAGDQPILFLDEGQDFPVLIKEWRRQDSQYVETGDQSTWQDLGDFMKSRGVKQIEYDVTYL